MATAARLRTTATNQVPLGAFPLTRTTPKPAVKVFIVAGSVLQQAALGRSLGKSTLIEVVGASSHTPFEPQIVVGKGVDVLLLASSGKILDDMLAIRAVRTVEPNLEIVMLGRIAENSEFLQLVRAGMRGYVSPDARPEEILQAIVEVRGGAAVCPGKLCAQLFRYFESEANSLPSSSIHQRLGLTRREQQLIPFVAKGLTNKEIANHFSLSEQTVKNHLYRMKHKIGAQDRLSIVHLCRMQGFMV